MTMDDKDRDISLRLATFDQLWDEIQTRVTAVVIAFDRPLKGERNARRSAIATYFHGGLTAARGLLVYATNRIESRLLSSDEPVDDEELA